MEEQITYQDIMDSQLYEWDVKIKTKIQELQLESDNCEPGEKGKFREQIDELKIKQLFLQDRLDELKKTIETAWTEMKTEIDFAWKILIKTINQSIFEKN